MRGKLITTTQKKIIEDFNKYLQTKTLVKYKCQNCNKELFEKILQKDRYGIEANMSICKHCGLVSTNPRLSSEDYRYFYNKFYRKIYNDISSPNDEYFNQRLGVAKKLLLQINKKKTINNSSVLDVGCSSGSLVNMVNDFGGYGEGLDLNEDFIAFGLSKGLSLFVGTIHDLDNTKKYDIVVYRHVFEHIADINLELEKIYDLLNPNGLLYIEVPGLLNLHASYRLNIREYHQNAHIHHFTASDLKNALSKHGLMVIECNEEIKCYARKSETTKIEFTRNYLHNTQYISRLKWRRWFLYVFSNYGRKSVLMIAKKWLRFIKRIFSKNRYYIVK